MKLVGLTGGIATGKTTVSSMLRRLGAEIIDADEVAREIVQPGREAWKEVVDAFGRGILRDDKTIDREKLRKIVFADEKARRKLESITHPRIRRLAQEKIDKLTCEGVKIAVYVAPLFFENRLHEWLRPVILVACEDAVQRKRLRIRDRLSETEIDQHLRAQMPLDEKRRLADFVVENNGSVEELEERVKELWEKLLQQSF
ncbi:MAG: dephospho-CoA kinase [Deltaproteobacteria bacterium]|nr:dephospho-CoA kinase [Deltaproteobacteria bacterium]